MNNATMSAGRLTTPLLGIGGIGLLVSLGVAMVALIGQGHAAFNTTDDGVSWGLPVATYVYFVLSSTGLTFVASLAMVFGFKDYYPIAKRCVWLAVATLIAGFASLTLELGHPFRMLWAIPLNMGQAYTSPLNWMGIFYAAYLVLLLLKFMKVNDDDWGSRASRNLGIAAFVTVVAAHGTIGMVFGAMAMRPYWFGGLIPLYFLASAFLSGVAFATLITYVAFGFDQNAMPARVKALMTGAMPKLFVAAIALVGLFMIFRTVIGLWSNADGLQVFWMMTKSPLFWFEVIVGMLVPFYLMLAAGTHNQATMQVLSAVLVLIALFIGRYEYVIGGQLVPLFKGSWVPAVVEYTPSMTEWMLTLMSISITVTLYAVGERMFNLSAEPSNN